MIEISHDVALALEQGLPVVALESSVIAQGLPKTAAWECALAVEAEVRAAGAAPATIGIIDGAVRVGLGAEDIRRLASSDQVSKCSAGEIAVIAGRRKVGATTVSATAYIADAVGIEVLATGGIGGVHRKWQESLDISADLHQLTRSSVVVVCSGPKAITDLHATAEWLESHNVPVVGLGVEEMPAFYTRESGVRLPMVRRPEDVADIWLAKRELGQGGSLIVAVPPPVLPQGKIEAAVEKAVREADHAGVKGPELTPRLLQRIADLTGGDSVRVNIALLKNNAAVAGRIATALATAKASL